MEKNKQQWKNNYQWKKIILYGENNNQIEKDYKWRKKLWKKIAINGKITINRKYGISRTKIINEEKNIY